jgi:hypothetical protein
MHEADFQRELAEIQAESLGWIPLESGAYLHVSDENATEVLVVGLPQVWVMRCCWWGDSSRR